jgi:hypothetical protein
MLRCSNVKGVNFVFKYVHKGFGVAGISFFQNIRIDAISCDEILRYRNTRSVSSHEYFWALIENNMNKRYDTPFI